MTVKYIIKNPDFKNMHDKLKTFLGTKFAGLNYPPLTIILNSDLTSTEKTTIRDYYLSHDFISVEKIID